MNLETMASCDTVLKHGEHWIRSDTAVTIYSFPELDEVSSGQPTLHGIKAKRVQPLSICHFRERLYALGPSPLHTFEFPSILFVYWGF